LTSVDLVPTMFQSSCTLFGAGPCPAGVGAAGRSLTSWISSGSAPGRRSRAAAGGQVRHRPAAVSAGHGVHRSFSTLLAGGRRSQRRGPFVTLFSRRMEARDTRSAAGRRPAAISAGHGVHRSNSIARRDAETQTHRGDPTSAPSRLRVESSPGSGRLRWAWAPSFVFRAKGGAAFPAALRNFVLSSVGKSRDRPASRPQGRSCPVPCTTYL
jgi:hypothetical protein